jgi:hypothetical protein
MRSFFVHGDGLRDRVAVAQERDPPGRGREEWRRNVGARAARPRNRLAATEGRAMGGDNQSAGKGENGAGDAFFESPVLNSPYEEPGRY